MYSSLETCRELGLIEDVKMRTGSNYCKVSILTEEGFKLASKLFEIKEMLDEHGA